MSRYSPHPCLWMVQEWLTTLEAKTGRDLAAWLKEIKRAGPTEEAARRAWLKSEHGLATNTCCWLAERSVGKGTEEDSPEAYLAAATKWVDEMFAGKRAGLRPVYERLLDQALSVKGDVRACPGKTVVSLYRHHVFAQIKVATNTRIDLGLAFGPLMKAGKDVPAGVIDTGGFAKKDRITHKVEIATVKDVGATTLKMLKMAYGLDSKA